MPHRDTMRSDSRESEGFAVTQTTSWSHKTWHDCMAQGVLFAAFLGAENLCNQSISKELY